MTDLTLDEKRIKHHFDAIRDALESATDSECTKYMRRVKADNATISVDQLYLDWRNGRLAAEISAADDPEPHADDVETIRKTFEAIIYSMGQAQIFGNDIKREILNTERWAKEALSHLSAPIDVQAKADAVVDLFADNYAPLNAMQKQELSRLIVEQFSNKE